MHWNARRGGSAAGLVVLVALAAGPALAGEGFLDRNPKVHEAIPYGRDVVVTPAAAGPRPGPGDATRPEPPTDAAPSATPQP